MAFRSPFMQTMRERGFLHQCTDESGLDELLKDHAPVAAYIGFDCTAPSLHVGSLMQIMVLRWLQKCGHKPIVLMGGGTTKIGDPTGKDEARKMLTDEAIAFNMRGIEKLFGRYITFGKGPTDAIMINNDDWLNELKYIELLRDYGSLFSVNRMLTMDSVKQRLEREHHLSFLEFNYMILQAYDFVKLNEKYKCRLQIGGSDQWGNIVTGVEFQRKIVSDNYLNRLYKKHPKTGVISKEEYDSVNQEMENLPKEIDRELTEVNLFGLTTPLITTSSGAKMGKTEKGAVWLDAKMTSPYDFWQFWRNTEDADVGRFLRLFTELEMDRVRELEKLEGADINQAKIILANAVTALCHGPEEAKKAEKTARETFAEGGVGEDLPTVAIEKSRLKEGIPAFKLLHEAGLAASGGEARRLIQGGGAKINDAPFTEETRIITLADFGEKDIIKLSAGKKRHALVKARL